MIRNEEKDGTIYDEFVVKVENLKQANDIVQKFYELGYLFNEDIREYDCYYIARRIIMDSGELDHLGRSEFRNVVCNRVECENSKGFYGAMTYDDFIKYFSSRNDVIHAIVHDVKDRLPGHKKLVIVESEGISMPAIYYKSLGGFYHFSLFYETDIDNVYRKARIKEKWQIKNVTKWYLMPNI